MERRRRRSATKQSSVERPLTMVPSGSRVGLKPVQMGPLTFVLVLVLMMVTIVVLTINYRNASMENAQMFDDLSKAKFKYKVCFDDIMRQKKVYARLESRNEDIQQEMGDCVNQLKLLKDSEKMSIESIEEYGRNISDLLFEIKSLQRSIVLIKQNHQDLKKEKENSEQICIQKKKQLKLRTEKQSDELWKKEKMYQRTIESLEIKFKTLQRENQLMQQWKPQQEQNLKQLIDHLMQQAWQHQEQRQLQKELIRNMQNLTQNQNQQKQGLIQSQNRSQQKNNLRGLKHEFIQSQQRRDRSQRITRGEIKNSMPNQRQKKKGEIRQIWNQIQEGKGQSGQQNDGTWNIDQNILKKQRSGLKKNIEKAVALRPRDLSSPLLLKVNIGQVFDHQTNGSGSGKPVIQHSSPGKPTADNHSEASVVNGQRGFLTNVEGASSRENLAGNAAQQRKVSRSPVRLSGIVGSSNNTDNLDSIYDGSEADGANSYEEMAFQKHRNAIKANETEPVDYELEELDKLVHLDDYEKRK